MQAISLSLMVFCFALVKSSTYLVNDDNVVIFRGDKDRFTRKIACNESKAVCFDDSCTYCQCLEGETFVRTRGDYGECVSNELLVYATSDEAYFRVENDRHQLCLYYGDYNRVSFVQQGTCGDTEKYYWIWTNNGQLLNRKSLECMTNDYVAANGIHYIVMKECDKSNTKQKWRCERIHQGNYIKQRQSVRYLHYGECSNYVTAGQIHWSVASKWRRFNSTPTHVCSEAVGCEIFTGGSSIIILSNTKCEENSGEKEIYLRKTRCSLLSKQSQYLHNDTWKPLEMKNGSLEIAVPSINSQVSLKWNLQKTPISWEGLLVKVQFKCENTTGSNIVLTEHCVVVKYTGTFKGFYNDVNAGDRNCDNDGDHDKIGDDDKDGEHDGGTNDRKNDDETDKNKTKGTNSAEENNTQMIIIIVCVLVVLILTGVLVFIVCKHRNSRGPTRSSTGKKTIQDQNREQAVLPWNESKFLTSNQPTQCVSRQHDEVPQGPQNDNVDKTAFTSPEGYAIEKTNNDKGGHDGGHVVERSDAENGDTHVPPQSPQYEVPTSNEYEYPDLSQNHQYEYPSLKNERTAETDGDYTPLVRPSLNLSEDGCYTSLIKNEKTSEKVGTTAKQDDTDRTSYIDVIDSNYTPLAKSKDESEAPLYEPLLKNRQKK